MYVCMKMCVCIYVFMHVYIDRHCVRAFHVSPWWTLTRFEKPFLFSSFILALCFKLKMAFVCWVLSHIFRMGASSALLLVVVVISMHRRLLEKPLSTRLEISSTSIGNLRNLLAAAEMSPM